VVFALLVGGFTAVCSTEIFIQVWAPATVPTEVSCQQGTQGLILALRRARGAAAAETGGERAMLDRFRRALQPEWSHRAAIGRRCKGDREALKALAVIDELRYAEESAVRYESTDLARRRREVQAIERRMSRAAPKASGAVESPALPH
jgi:hypothetical protein